MPISRTAELVPESSSSRPQKDTRKTSSPRSASPPELDLTGRRVGHVRLLSLLDRGGMGEVYRGFDEALERVVAVKALRGDQRPEAEARSRFRREARLLSKLEHPNICRIYDFQEGDEEIGDFLILELIEGSKLEEEMAAGLKFEQKVRIAEEIAAALAAAHALRIVHRDVKPNNVMLNRSGQVKVLDFGLARSLEMAPEGFRETPTPLRLPTFETEPLLARSREKSSSKGRSWSASGSWAPNPLDTGSELMVGTLEFMSPEQAFGEELTEASDLYSFGLLLQWLFTGTSAYEGGQSRLDLLRKVLQADTLPIQGLDPDLTLLIEELKRHNPDHRPSSEECVRRLRGIHDKPARARRRRSGIALASLAALLIFAFLAFDRQQDVRRTAAAVELSHEAKDIEWLMRLARSIPLHDLRPHKVEVRRRMGAISGRLQTGGRLAEGPALYALGRGYLALGELDNARLHLQRAWQAGYRRPEVAFALGVTLGRLSMAVDAEQILCRESAWCAERALWADQSLRQPAANFFEQSQAPGGGLASYSEAVGDYYRGRWEEALQAAAKAETVPWLYEASLLIGDVELSRGDAWAREGSLGEAMAAYGRSEEAYSRGLAVGSSDPQGYLALCRLHHRIGYQLSYAGDLESVLSFEEGVGAGLGEQVALGRRACQQALEADPERPEPFLELARGLLMLAEVDLDLQTDDGEKAGAIISTRLQPAVQLIREADALAPGSSEAARLQSAAYRTWQKVLVGAGSDPEQTLRTALEHARRAIALDASDPGNLRAHIAASQGLAAWLEERGLDPRPALDEAVRSLRQILRQRRGFGRAHAELSEAYLARARYEEAHGISPDDALGAARAAAEKAMASADEDPYVRQAMARVEAAVK